MTSSTTETCSQNPALVAANSSHHNTSEFLNHDPTALSQELRSEATAGADDLSLENLLRNAYRREAFTPGTGGLSSPRIPAMRPRSRLSNFPPVASSNGTAASGTGRRTNIMPNYYFEQTEEPAAQRPRSAEYSLLSHVVESAIALIDEDDPTLSWFTEDDEEYQHEIIRDTAGSISTKRKRTSRNQGRELQQ